MNKNVPKLRFKEFSDEWINHLLSNFLEFYTTNSFSRDCLNMNEGKVNNIHYGDIHMKFPTILDLQRTKVPFINNDIDISKIKFESYCQDGDLIFADASEDYDDIGKAIEIQNIEKNKVVAGLHTILARDIKGVTASKFKGYMMLNESVRKQIKVLSVGTKVLGISKSNLEKVKVNIPSLQEQEKIADFFTILDSLIEEQEGKVRDLEIYKKGMMQKIFKQQIRFKDENQKDYPEWEDKKLDDIVICLDNKRKPLNSEDRNNKKGDIPYYGANGVVDYINEYIFDEELILLAEDGGNFDDFANKPIAQIINGKSWVNNHAHVLKSNNQYLKYIFYTLVHKDIRGYINGTSRAKLNKSDMLEIKIQLPVLEEQTKIANFLTNIDNLIEEEQKNLEDLREMKKGLLQQMFV